MSHVEADLVEQGHSDGHGLWTNLPTAPTGGQGTTGAVKLVF